MKDNSTELQKAFDNLFSGAITYNGITVPVHDAVPRSTTYPYIQFGDKTGNDFSTKDKFGETNTVLFSIVDRFEDGNQGSRSRINSVADDMFNLLKPSKGTVALSMTNFDVIRCIVEQDITLKELTETYMYFSREIRFNLQIQEL